MAHVGAMDKAVKLQTCLVNYFKQFALDYKEVKRLLDEVHIVGLKLCKLTDKYNKIQKASIVGTPLESVGNIKEKISCRILQDINESTDIINEKLIAIDKVYQFTKNRNSNIEKLKMDIDYKSNSILVRGSAYQPRLSDLIEYANDCVTFFMFIALQVESLIYNFSLDNKLIKSALVEYLTIDKHSEARVEEIIMLTKNCDQNELE